MKRFLLSLSILFTINGFSQISHGGTPISFNKSLVDAPIYITPILNVQPLINEDKVTDSHKDIAWRFGVEQFVTLNLSNSGLWTTLTNGDRVWRLEIKSPNAKSINLNYSQFNLPVGATFFVYNKNQILGSFTSENNKPNLAFSTSLLKGNSAILEYFEPLSVQGQGLIEISSVVHGYRDLLKKVKNFDDSGACNINSICDLTTWGEEIRSAVMLLTSGNTRFCSGALINNVLQDGTPYVLTADHCGPATNSIFMFNYQSPNCATNVDGFTTETVSGAILRANDTPSDFFLVELSSTPPISYNVFYSGWSNINTPPTSATGIHHPRGDVKKISHDTDPLIESGYYTAGNDHWEVLDWNSGTTEGGSSGSPLFDQNHRVVGQLHGGNAACGNDEFDYYGKFAVSWNTNSDITKQLQNWLDPNNTGATVLDGFDPNGTAFTNDAAVLNISGIPSAICGDSANPVITLRNKGNSTLTSVDIFYSLDGATPSVINWTGSLPTFSSTTVTLPILTLTNGIHNYLVYSSNPNGNLDENLFNDTTSFIFNANSNPLFATLNLTTDNFGAETSWFVRDNSTGIVVSEGGGYPDVTGGQSFTESLCLYDGCFTFVLNDAFGDGFCCAFGSGNMLLTEDATGDTLAIENSNTFIGDSVTFSFCMGNPTGITELSTSSFNIYPNPTNGIFTIIKNQKNEVDIIVYDVIGKIIYQKQNETNSKIEINLNSVTKGIYFVSIVSEDEKIVKRLVID